MGERHALHRQGDQAGGQQQRLVQAHDHGDDARRTEWSYKGLGRVVFTGGNVFGGGGGRVNRIDYDPTETGIRPNG